MHKEFASQLESLSLSEGSGVSTPTQPSHTGSDATVSPCPELDDTSSPESELRPQDTLLEVLSTPDRGLAVFTRRKIKAGTLILAETPLIFLSKADENDAVAIEKEFYRLSRPDQKAYLKLFDAQKSRMSQVVSIYYSNCYNCEGFKLDGTGGSALGAMASRINHSCIPNVQFSYHEPSNKMRFFTIRDIARGKEVVSNYERTVTDVAAKRQRKQQMYYGFTCRCEACVPRSEFWEKSDERRKGMHDAIRTVQVCEKRFVDRDAAIAQVERVEIATEALEALAKLETLLSKESLVGVPLANAYRSMAKWEERKGEIDSREVMKWKTRELEVCTNAFGKDAQRTMDIRVKLEELRAG
ncbi:hypothetical protein H2200_004323 [Cladophialophora chaetospira]|uniref:SET domain-containing protein n=1 Tax=Cladophialophora chaetospira TaxID=386627 RepID=A0AA38XD35_9EURO|nr:hypothetical protein H2200_004323 [Cladophialophora chaetospira]